MEEETGVEPHPGTIAEDVRRVLEILQTELKLAMAHTGRPTIASIDRTLVAVDFP